jgi:hypothetical protein
MKCVNLHRKFPKLKHTWDPARRKGDRDPWMMIIPCRYGDIGPFGGDFLMWESEDRNFGVFQNLLRAGFDGHNEGDDYRSVVFHIRDWARVAKIVKPRTKRTLSPERRAQAAANFARARDK